MYRPPSDINAQYENGFRRAAASFGLSPHLLGAKIDMRRERERAHESSRYPDFVYFRGYRPGQQCGFALTRRPDGMVSGWPPEKWNVAMVWIDRVLADPENAHLRAAPTFLSHVGNSDLAAILLKTSYEDQFPVHVSELLAEAAKRLA